MVKLLKYLRSSIIPIIAIFILLFAQAMCDLSLPTYTSDIINVGVQQSGIEHVTPEAIRESVFSQFRMYLTEEEYNKILSQYERKQIDKLSENELNSLKDEYPIIEKEVIYVLKKDADMDALDYSMSKALMLATSGGQAAPMVENLDAQMLEQAAIQITKQEYETIGIDLKEYQKDYLIITGAKMLGLALVVMLTAILVTLIASRVAAKVSMMLRQKVFKKVVSFSNAEMDQFSTASLITRSTNDIQQVQMLIVMLLRMVLYAPILGIGGVLKVINTNTDMVWIIGLAVGLILVVVLILLVVAMPKFNAMQKLVDRLNLVTREILTGLPVIRAFSTERHEEKRFEVANRDLTRTMLFTSRAMTFMFPIMMLIMNGITVLIIWNGGHGIDSGSMRVGDMMAFLQYTMQIVMSFLMLTMISIILPRASVSAKRIDEVLTTKNMILDKKETKTLTNLQGVVAFNHVNFRYPKAEEDALSGIDFVAQPGKTTAIIGSTGCGKSTLVNLIPRLYDVTEGSVTIDGMDIRDLTQHELRSLIGFVPQKGNLFSGTIESNITFGQEEVPKEQVEKAARIAQATEFIEEKNDQYESEIAQGGSNVSGGQKQRLSIARAIAKNPKVYIFDDSFSALDYKTDVALRKALKEETADATVIIVAQRISTILHADQIIVLEDGAIVSKGTHRELLNHSEVYRQIALSQLSEEEIKKDLDADKEVL